MFALEGVDLHITKKAIKTIAREAFKMGSGARGLRSIMEQYLLNIMYELPEERATKKCIVDENVILKNEKPRLVKAKSTKEKKE